MRVRNSGVDGMKIKLVISFIIALVIIFSWNFYPRHYKETLHGVYYHLNNEEFSEKITIHLEGKRRNHLFGDKKFEGTVVFEGEVLPPVPDGVEELEVRYERGIGIINSFFREDEQGAVFPEIYHFGSIHINKNFTQFTIQASIPSSLPSDDIFMITAPAETREEALQIHNNIMKIYR